MAQAVINSVYLFNGSAGCSKRVEGDLKNRRAPENDSMLDGEAPLGEKKEPDTWTQEQQKLLEQGLIMKLFPSSDPARWEQIAKCVGSKAVKECKTRYKAIALALKKAKAA